MLHSGAMFLRRCAALALVVAWCSAAWTSAPGQHSDPLLACPSQTHGSPTACAQYLFQQGGALRHSPRAALAALRSAAHLHLAGADEVFLAAELNAAAQAMQLSEVDIAAEHLGRLRVGIGAALHRAGVCEATPPRHCDDWPSRAFPQASVTAARGVQIPSTSNSLVDVMCDWAWNSAQLALLPGAGAVAKDARSAAKWLLAGADLQGAGGNHTWCRGIGKVETVALVLWVAREELRFGAERELRVWLAPRVLAAATSALASKRPPPISCFDARHTALQPITFLALCLATGAASVPWAGQQWWRRALPLHAKSPQRLRLLWLSPDLHEGHPYGIQVKGMLEELQAPSSAMQHVLVSPIALQQPLRADVQFLPDGVREASRMLAQAQADILMDGQGAVAAARPGVLHRRAVAAVHVAAVALTTTSGVANTHFAWSCPSLVPAEFAWHFAEQQLYLPAAPHFLYPSALVSSALQAPQPPHQVTAPQHPHIRLVLAPFKHRKLTLQALQLWMSSVLRLPNTAIAFTCSQAHASALRRVSAALGLHPRRLRWLPHLPKARHMQRLKRVDLQLDHFNMGHTTALDALLSGTPIATVVDDHVGQRVPASALAATLPARLRPGVVTRSQRSMARSLSDILSCPTCPVAIRRRLASAVSAFWRSRQLGSAAALSLRAASDVSRMLALAPRSDATLHKCDVWRSQGVGQAGGACQAPFPHVLPATHRHTARLHLE